VQHLPRSARCCPALHVPLFRSRWRNAHTACESGTMPSQGNTSVFRNGGRWKEKDPTPGCLVPLSYALRECIRERVRRPLQALFPPSPHVLLKTPESALPVRPTDKFKLSTAIPEHQPPTPFLQKPLFWFPARQWLDGCARNVPTNQTTDEPTDGQTDRWSYTSRSLAKLSRRWAGEAPTPRRVAELQSLSLSVHEGVCIMRSCCRTCAAPSHCCPI
jgi:hypothetical protein